MPDKANLKVSVTIDDNDTALILERSEAFDDADVEIDDELLIEKEIVGVTAKTAATLSTNLAGNNNDLVYTAVEPGSNGNNITIAYVDPGGNDQVLGVGVTGNDIVVSLATNGGGTITSTADDIKATLLDSEDASALVTAVDKAANDGSGVVIAMAPTHLATGGLTITRSHHGTFGATHDNGTDVFIVSRVASTTDGPEVYFLGDSVEDDVSEDNLNVRMITTVPKIFDTRNSDGLDDVNGDNIRPGQLYCYWNPATLAFHYIGQNWDGDAVAGSETLDLD